MESGLLSKNFEISTPFFTFPATYVAPVWAQGFECKLCGLCCLTEKPNGVPEIHDTRLDRPICRFYDDRKRLCRKYDGRPELCKTYPFIIGVESGKIKVSASLECPGTNTKQPLDTNHITDLGKIDWISKWINYLNDCYENAVLNNNLWCNAEYVRDQITKWVQESLIGVNYFPFSLKVIDAIRREFAVLFKIENYESPQISVPSFLRKIQGLYIATRFEAYSLGNVITKGSKLEMSLFDENLVKTKNVKIKIPYALSELKMDRNAQSLLNDYISLVLSRPYLSLATVLTSQNGRSVPINLLSTLSGAITQIDGGATVIARRDNLATVDRDSMREIISFCEGNVLSSFIRPDIVKEL